MILLSYRLQKFQKKNKPLAGAKLLAAKVAPKKEKAAAASA